jgi:hypothetical protein
LLAEEVVEEVYLVLTLEEVEAVVIELLVHFQFVEQQVIQLQ